LSTFDNLSDSEYWKHLREFWTECEDRSGASSWLISLFRSSRGQREALMSAEEHATLAALPDPATLYRGVTFFPGSPLKYARGMSWTDDLDIAAHFAYPPAWLDGAILIAEVPRRRILAYFHERGEHEVVIDPRPIAHRVHPRSIEEGLDRSAIAWGRLEEHVDDQLRREKESRNTPVGGF
jgi:hypothetical protein